MISGAPTCKNNSNSCWFLFTQSNYITGKVYFTKISTEIHFCLVSLMQKNVTLSTLEVAFRNSDLFFFCCLALLLFHDDQSIGVIIHRLIHHIQHYFQISLQIIMPYRMVITRINCLPDELQPLVVLLQLVTNGTDQVQNLIIFLLLKQAFAQQFFRTKEDIFVGEGFLFVGFS